MNVLNEILTKKLVVIARAIPQDKIKDCVNAVIDGGVSLIESTFCQSDKDCIEKNKLCIETMVKAANGRAIIGAGTVLNTEQVRAAYEAGAKYIISPNTNEAVIKETLKLGMISIPGAMTPTEIEQAYSYGAHIVKLFPADDMGVHYIKNLKAPLSHIPLMATGGVNPGTIPEYYNAGAEAFGTGITILKPDCVASGNFAEITRLARAHVDVIKKLIGDENK